MRSLLIATLAGASTLAAQEKLSIDIYYGSNPTEDSVAITGPAVVESPAYEFKAARIIPIEGDPIENGVILTRNGKITAIGRADDRPKFSPEERQRLSEIDKATRQITKDLAAEGADRAALNRRLYKLEQERARRTGAGPTLPRERPDVGGTAPLGLGAAAEPRRSGTGDGVGVPRASRAAGCGAARPGARRARGHGGLLRPALRGRPGQGGREAPAALRGSPLHVV